MEYQQEDLIRERTAVLEMCDPTLGSKERVIRLILVVGFVLMLTIEAWLLWRVYQVWP